MWIFENALQRIHPFRVFRFLSYHWGKNKTCFFNINHGKICKIWSAMTNFLRQKKNSRFFFGKPNRLDLFMQHGSPRADCYDERFTSQAIFQVYQQVAKQIMRSRQVASCPRKLNESSQIVMIISPHIFHFSYLFISQFMKNLSNLILPDHKALRQWTHHRPNFPDIC